MDDTRPPTILIGVTQGFAARYMLQSDILPALLEAGARVVVLTPNADDPTMRAEYPGVHFEPLRHDLGKVERSTLHFVISHARMYSLAGRSGAFINRWENFERRYRQKNPWLMRILRPLVHLAWRSRRMRLALIAAEQQRYALPVHADVFERWQPDVVVTATIGYVKEDAIVLREARARGVPAVAVITGWDNPSSKGYRGVEPDRVIAWSERMAELVADIQDYPRDRILTAGVAHFDRYVRPDGLPGRDELFRDLGLDPARRLVVYMTSSPGAWARNVDVGETIAAAMADGRLQDAQLVIRVHPNFFRSDTPASIEPFNELAAQHPHVHLDVPGVIGGDMRIRLDRDDAVRLGGLIKHADALVNLFSTTTVEACLLDTPVVQVTQFAYDEPDERFAGTRRQRWEEYIHMRRVVERGATRIARSPEEIVRHLASYLADPGLERKERAESALVECGPTDGRAGERIAGLLLELAGG